MDLPTSCDTFVVLPPSTAQGFIVFGKNSNRPSGEVQEVVYFPAADYPADSKIQCTYIEVEQVPHTHSVILSKPAWMWGAEMGANEYGVCIGNEAVRTKLNGPEDDEERLLGSDLVRLGLERATTALDALKVITELLDKYGQGGPCSESGHINSYHSSFLIVDRSEAYVLETAGKYWAAEHITSGHRNISNTLSIGTKIDLMHDHLKEYAQSSGLWDPNQGDLNFCQVFGDHNETDTKRFNCGKNLLSKLSASGEFGISSMLTVLRDSDSEICRGPVHTYPTASSQVSVITSVNSPRPCCHWFTGTPDPCHSIFKPFIFCPKVRISPHIQSPKIPEEEDPAKIQPRFQKTVDRSHVLYRYHQRAYSVMTGDGDEGEELCKTMQELESKCLQDMERFLDNFTPENYSDAADLFKDIVESEIKFYK
ncbi:secernin-1-like [Limulus polyphemus]|uniref:Secernin-1-like n=1 Tax=Limulus polyphemus TaxID=6850 RepID=A0ABM1BGA0_LIMPO|nr:secernin-1-like [Limulus polyphemus]